MEKKKKNQHYVFQAYLKPWAERGLIYCLREGRIFRANLTGVACESFFYRFQDLTPEEFQLIERLFGGHPSDSLKAAQKDFMSLYSFPIKLRRHLADGAGPRFLDALDKVIVEGEEDFHQKIEDGLLVFLKRMLAGKTDFYPDNAQSANFLYALCVQYTRTKRVREAVVDLAGPNFRGCDLRRMMSVLAPVMAMAVAHSLYLDKAKFKLVLLDNDTDTPLLTADQPIVNLQQTHPGKPPEKFEFYYPLSPRKAMLLLESSSSRGDFPLTAVSVNNYNVMMVTNSYEQIFSNSQEYLNSVKNVVR
jgi:hypothetical protein